MRTCTVEGCTIPISPHQDFCPRCWNNVPERYKSDYQQAQARFRLAQRGYVSAMKVARTSAEQVLIKN